MKPPFPPQLCWTLQASLLTCAAEITPFPQGGYPEGNMNGCGQAAVLSWVQYLLVPFSPLPPTVTFFISEDLKLFFLLLLLFFREDLDQEEKAKFGEYCSSENGKGREWFARFVSAQVRAGARRSAQVRGGDGQGAGGV